MDEKPKRKPRAVLESGLPPELQARLERATDRTKSRFAPKKTDIIRRGIELALKEHEELAVAIANELADARGLKADFVNVFYAADTPEGTVYGEALRIVGILRGRI